MKNTQYPIDLIDFHRVNSNYKLDHTQTDETITTNNNKNKKKIKP